MQPACVPTRKRTIWVMPVRSIWMPRKRNKWTNVVLPTSSASRTIRISLRSCLLYTSPYFCGLPDGLRQQPVAGKRARSPYCLLYTSNVKGDITDIPLDIQPDGSFTKEVTLPGTTPVSYTHLDVYKRQVQGDVECGCHGVGTHLALGRSHL